MERPFVFLVNLNNWFQQLNKITDNGLFESDSLYRFGFYSIRLQTRVGCIKRTLCLMFSFKVFLSKYLRDQDEFQILKAKKFYCVKIDHIQSETHLKETLQLTSTSSLNNFSLTISLYNISIENGNVSLVIVAQFPEKRCTVKTKQSPDFFYFVL